MKIENLIFSVNLFSFNGYMVNDFMSLKLYNDINGADFEYSAEGSSAYYPKEEFLSYVQGDEIQIEGGFIAPLPGFNFAVKNYGISMLNRTYFRTDIPKDILEMLLYGNESDKKLYLEIS